MVKRKEEEEEERQQQQKKKKKLQQIHVKVNVDDLKKKWYAVPAYL